MQDRYTALMYAVDYDNYNAAAALLSQGADVTATNNVSGGCGPAPERPVARVPRYLTPTRTRFALSSSWDDKVTWGHVVAYIGGRYTVHACLQLRVYRHGPASSCAQRLCQREKRSGNSPLPNSLLFPCPCHTF